MLRVLFQVDKEEQERANNIREKWETLFFEASEVDHNLGGIKRTFTEVIFVINIGKKIDGKENNLNTVLFRLHSIKLRTTAKRSKISTINS